MLSYRTLFTINPASRDVDVVQGVLQETADWLRYKNLDPDAMSPNREVEAGDRARLKWLVPTAHDLIGTQRIVLTEENQAGTWISTMTVRQPPSGAPWFWMDVHGPHWAKAPRLARSVIDRYSCLDRGVRLTKKPTTVYPQQVDELIELLGRANRRTLSFVAGSNPGLPMKEWSKLVGDILHQTVGQASGYVLDPAATQIFNQKIGASFAVRPGMLRTYLPELDIHDPQDAPRHRFLTADSIATQDVWRLRRTLSNRAREVAQELLLDRAVRDLDRRMDEFELLIAPSTAISVDTIGVSGTTPGVQPEVEDGRTSEPQEIDRSVGQPLTGSTDRDPEDRIKKSTSQSPESLGGDGEFYLAIRALVDEYSGGQVSLAGVEVIRGLLKAGSAADALSTRLLAKVDQKSAALDEAEVEKAKLRELVDDLELDAWDLWEELEAQYELARVAQMSESNIRGMLAKSAADVDWAALDNGATRSKSSGPENFNSLVESFHDLPFVIFTGDKDITAGLDSYDAVGRWCGISWSILCALNDYARLKTEGSDIGGVHAFLENPPAGCRTYLPGRHARDESESVKSNPSFYKSRLLSVPTEISSTGDAFMGAHFRIAKHGMISPRLHYLDATASMGKIIVGYIGPHLPNTQSN